MPKSQNPFEMDFDSYILQSEPLKQEKGRLWQTAIGLQQVDGLTPSKYLYETARRNIEGDITIEEAKRLVDSYYECALSRNIPPNVTVNVTVKLTVNQKNILDIVKENPNISQEAIASELGLARETVNRNMKKLQESNVLKRLGADKNGRWEIV